MRLFRKPRQRAPEHSHNELDERIERAEAQRDEAATTRAAAEDTERRLRKQLERNKLGERFKAAFEARERHA